MAPVDLSSFGNLSELLQASDAPAANTFVGAQEVEIALIDEDPNQPRKTFSEDYLQELAGSISVFGVKVPISIRDNPDAPGRYILNDGACRYRASKALGKTTIRSVIGEPFSLLEQVVVNALRRDAPPKDKAMAYKLIMEKYGFNQMQLAEAHGFKPTSNPGEKPKPVISEAQISQYLALLSLPPVIDEVFESGRCQDITLISQMAKIYKKSAEEVSEWLADDEQEITRGSVKLFRDFLDSKKNQAPEEVEIVPPMQEDDQSNSPQKESPEVDPAKLKKAIIQVEHNSRLARLILTKRPTAAGSAWLKYEDDGEEFETVLCDVQIVQLLEG